MPTIMADHDVEGHLQVLLSICLSPQWIDLWTEAQCSVETFERLGLEKTLATRTYGRYVNSAKSCSLRGTGMRRATNPLNKRFGGLAGRPASLF